MKKFYVILAALVGAYVLTACQSTSNSPSPTTSSAQTCTTLANGQQYCTSSSGTCSGQTGLTYNSSTGYWYNSAGQVVSCNTSGLTTGTTGSCQEWDSVYPGANYVPMVDPTTGNLICYNAAAYGVSVPNTYSYSNSNPVYGSICPYNQYNDPNWVYDCGGGWAYTGSDYGYGSSGSGWCMAVGDGDGDDYGYGDGFFGVCGF